MAKSPDDLELLAVLMMDVRATVESMRRSVTNAQSSIEQLRHTYAATQVADIKDCLEQILKEAAAITDTTTEAKKPLAQLEVKPTTRRIERRKKPS